MSNLFDYSATPALNQSAAPNGAAEGMPPSGLNDSMRQLMANAAGAFTCYTAGGSANAQTVTMSPTLAAYSNKVRIAFIPVANNTGACTLNVNGLGAVSIKMLDGTDPPAGALNSSGVAIVQHNGTNFRLLNPAWGEVSGYVSGGRTYSHTSGANSTVFNVDVDITEATFESIGPTGSGADNIWTAMNDIPDGARLAILGVDLRLTPSGVDTNPRISAYVRGTGTSAAVSNFTCIAQHTFLIDDNATVSSTSPGVFCTAIVPLDSSRRFDATWQGLSDSAQVCDFYLKGFIL